MLSLNIEAITNAIKRVFKLKKFANVEFSAKQAFEDFDTAMIWLQAFLVCALIALIIVCCIQLRRLFYRQAFHRAEVLMSRLSSQITLLTLPETERLPEDQRLGLEMGRKETLLLLVKQMQKRRVEKLLGERHASLILLMLNYMTHLEVNEKVLENHRVLIKHIERSLQIVQR